MTFSCNLSLDDGDRHSTLVRKMKVRNKYIQEMRKDDDDTAHLLDGRKKNVILLFTDGYSPVIFTV